MEEQILKEAVRDGLLAAWREDNRVHRRRIGQYYPSGLGSCLRRQYYEYVDPRPPEPETLAVFATGKGIHEAVADALSNSSSVKVERVELPVKLKISEEASLSGRVDILLAEIAGKKAIVEVKSTSTLPSEPHLGHVMQLQTYLHALDLDLGLILYWDKKTGELECFRSLRDVSWLQEVGERVVILHEHLKAGRPPRKEAYEEGRYWQCDLCPYKTTCDPYSLPGVPAGSRLAVFGTVAEQQEGVPPGEVRPEPGALARKAGQAKLEGDVVVVLSDLQAPQSDRVMSALNGANVQFDVFFPKPRAVRSAVYWKAELVRRLSEKHKVRSFADPVARAAELVAPYTERREVLG
ncbi:MAG: PD-(D/E)XK nuclease family protein [Nitrososphaerota archaeon]|nr:PD-(D/E)XK nuclease family protein [Nitrososphaerota archaeon]MDG6940134.1 PD-(D/E)XK nuclease family protein [Nitrososphaerota archaeon]